MAKGRRRRSYHLDRYNESYQRSPEAIEKIWRNASLPREKFMGVEMTEEDFVNFWDLRSGCAAETFYPFLGTRWYVLCMSAFGTQWEARLLVEIVFFRLVFGRINFLVKSIPSGDEFWISHKSFTQFVSECPDKKRKVDLITRYRTAVLIRQAGLISEQPGYEERKKERVRMKMAELRDKRRWLKAALERKIPGTVNRIDLTSKDSDLVAIPQDENLLRPPIHPDVTLFHIDDRIVVSIPRFGDFPLGPVVGEDTDLYRKFMLDPDSPEVKALTEGDGSATNENEEEVSD